MKRILLIVIILIGILGCGKKETTESNNEDSQTTASVENTQTENTENPTNSSAEVDSAPAGSYASALEERIEKTWEKVQADLDSGVTSQMANATDELYNTFKKELDTVYDLLEKKLPENEKKELHSTQDAWKKSVEEEKKKFVEEFGEGQDESLISQQTETTAISDRAMELARWYDKVNK